MKNGLKKTSLATIFLAKKFIALKKGDQLEPLVNYTEESNLSRGTIQNAMREIKDSKAIAVKSRGHLGTFVLDIDYKKLWALIHSDSLVGVMPLPYSKAYEGLATGLKMVAQDYGIDLKMAFVNGSKNRIGMLEDGKYDFAIMSALTAKDAIKSGRNISVAMNFGEESYLSEHVLIFSSGDHKEILNGMKIGIDPNSLDMKLITEEVCKGKNVDYILMPYNQITEQIKSAKIDVAVWNKDEIDEKFSDINYKSISDISLIRESSIASLIINKDEEGSKHFFHEIIDRVKVLDIINKVKAREIMPEY